MNPVTASIPPPTAQTTTTLLPLTCLACSQVSGAGGLVLDAVLHRGDELTDEEPGVEDIAKVYIYLSG